MKILKIRKKKIFFLIKKIVRIIKKKINFKILLNLFIKKIKKKILFITSNNEIQLEFKINIKKNYDNIKFLIDSEKFIKIISYLKNSNYIYIYIIKNIIILKSKKYNTILKSQKFKNFPIFNKIIKKKICFKVKEYKIKKIFKILYNSISNINAKYSLNGLLINIEKKKISFLSTDGFRLSYYFLNIKNNYKTKIIIPKKNIFEIIKILNYEKKKIKIIILKNYIIFKIFKIKFISRLIKEDFINYKYIINKKYRYKIKINRKKILNIIKKISLIEKDKIKIIKFNIKRNNLKISSFNKIEEISNEKININYKNKNININLNIKYLLEILTNIKNKHIIFKFNKKKSILIKIYNKKNFKYIIMPIEI
ncbi:DNA polymerase III, beta subunit [Candidatus Zinderia insecticola CARI]|uniref:Beta sliding clamp n=1 Tax=Zinderia insecticola (strain CARI) TaxID=871271 RepID=E0TIX9_ZINIC|nr:DNA polymerase III, beta subunit [Candidatus Zinderia insecticola CARI]